MITQSDARRFVSGMSWPEDAPRPFVRFFDLPGGGFTVLLHETLHRGWADIARINGPTPEGALAAALEAWLTHHGLNNQPALYAEIKRLTN
jgi:hypothetical protein